MDFCDFRKDWCHLEKPQWDCYTHLQFPNCTLLWPSDYRPLFTAVLILPRFLWIENKKFNRISVCIVGFMKILYSASFNLPRIIWIPVWTMLSPTIVSHLPGFTPIRIIFGKGVSSVSTTVILDESLGIEGSFLCWKADAKEKPTVYFS